jgi:trimethylamine:corrinoid methyltransferase-like protein
MGDLPTMDLVRQLLDEKHMLTVEHTLAHWKQDMYLPSAVIDRTNRDAWHKQGSPLLNQRVRDDVDKRLAAYQPIETDPATVNEMLRMIREGLYEGELPEIPAQLKHGWPGKTD